MKECVFLINMQKQFSCKVVHVWMDKTTKKGGKILFTYGKKTTVRAVRRKQQSVQWEEITVRAVYQQQKILSKQMRVAILTAGWVLLLRGPG